MTQTSTVLLVALVCSVTNNTSLLCHLNTWSVENLPYLCFSDDQNNRIHAVQFMILSTFDCIYTVAVLLFVFNSAFKIKGIYLKF